MSNYSTATWGYKILSDNKINFYHVLLPKISISQLESVLPDASYIKQQKDGSVTIVLRSNTPSLEAVDKIVSFFSSQEQESLDTPNFRYVLETKTRHKLQTWALAFEGCLALLLTHDKDIQPLINNWHYINSTTGGLFLEPFTLLLYANHPKIIHPITLQNYEARKQIEQKTAAIVRQMLKHIAQAQPGLEGVALLSLVESKTKLSQKEIRRIINEKSFNVKTPLYCTFFTG